jgi:hypothetical protein
MNPFVVAFLTVGPICFLAGFLLRSALQPRKDPAMAVYQELVQPLADLQAAVEQLPAKLQAASAASTRTRPTPSMR